MNCTLTYDDELANASLFQRFPELLPFVGTEYGSVFPKVLLIAESHYLPKESLIHLDAEGWYRGSSTNLKGDEPIWINTRRLVNKGKWTVKGHTRYRLLAHALVESGFPVSENAFRYVAFMNGFQRPAVYKDSIKVVQSDVDTAIETVNHVVSVLKPDHIIFVSRKAKRIIGPRLFKDSYAVPHPASAWWHRASKRGTGKDQFMRLLGALM